MKQINKKITEIAVFFDNGDIIETQINGDRESIKDYYLGKSFNLGSGENDLMAIAKDIIIYDCSNAYRQYPVLKFAYECKKKGKRVFLSESNNHGFITDNEGSRVLSFEGYFSGVKLSGNYKSDNNGTGWGLLEFAPSEFDKNNLEEWLYSHSPWTHNGYTTLKEHLNKYQSSSKYREI